MISESSCLRASIRSSDSSGRLSMLLISFTRKVWTSARALTCWVVDKRAIYIELDLTFFPMLWQISPIDAGAARSCIIAT
jgi:hypothetical protein